MILEKPDLHPSYFQDDFKNIKENTQNQRTLLSVREERERTLAVDDLKKLQSPGKFNFTVDDERLRGSNTNSMFKNLYGETLLTFLFFSDKNVQNIQRLIRMTVFRHTKEVIDNQSNTELLVVMRSVFLAYSQHPKLIDASMSDKERKALLAQYTDEVDRLNQIVIDTCVPLVVSQLQQYLVYLHDASSPLRVMEKPLSTSVKGTKTNRSQSQVLMGSDI